MRPMSTQNARVTSMPIKPSQICSFLPTTILCWVTIELEVPTRGTGDLCPVLILLAAQHWSIGRLVRTTMDSCRMCLMCLPKYTKQVEFPVPGIMAQESSTWMVLSFSPCLASLSYFHEDVALR